MATAVRLLKFSFLVLGVSLAVLTVIKDAAERHYVAVGRGVTIPPQSYESEDPANKAGTVEGSESVSATLSDSARNRERLARSMDPTKGGNLIALSPTEISDIFISVKTSGKFHKSRLALLLDTWIPLANSSVYVFTDTDDFEFALEATGIKLINTGCPTGHDRQHLSCKLEVELDTYFRTNKRWFCHVDDDNYVNVNNLLLLLRRYNHMGKWYIGKSSLGHPLQIVDPIEKDHFVALWFATGGAGFCISQALAKQIAPQISGRRFSYWSDMIHLPDDCTLGYIVCHLARQTLTEVSGLHSHLEGLWILNDNNIGQQITFSYGYFEDKDRKRTPNVVSVTGSNMFNITTDPTRLLSSHCLMFPWTQQCDKYRVTR